MTESGRRRTHRKVRTGCITCKIRRVKCDEEKPSCRRCRSTGRRCDGYAFYPSSSGLSDDPASLYDGQVTIPMQVLPTGKFTPLEIRGLDFFHCNTVKSLSSFVDTELWSKLLLRLGEHEPAIKHGMIAFSAYHELAATRGFDALFRGATGADEFALKEYNIAIGHLWRHLSSGKASRTVALVACLLFICLEFVRGNRDTALTHLRNGMAMLRLPAAVESSSPGGSLIGGFGGDMDSAGGCGSEDDVIAPAFARISLVQTLSGQPREARYMDFLALPNARPPPNGIFSTFEEARQAMNNLGNAAYGFSYMTDNMRHADQNAVDAAQATILAGIEAWTHAFAPYLDPSQNPDIRGACAMQATLLLAKLWTHRAPSPLETAYDNHFAEFREMLDLIEYVLAHTSPGAFAATSPGDNASPSSTSSFRSSGGADPDPLSHTFTVDTGLISNLFYVAVKCRDRVLRRRALALLKACPRCEGLWDAVESLKVAELIVRTEEESLPPMPAPDLPEENARVADWDVHRREPGADRQRVFLSRCRFNTPKEMDLMRADHIYWDE